MPPASPPPQLEDRAGNAAFTLRKLYEKLLRPFDDYQRQRAEGGYGLLGALGVVCGSGGVVRAPAAAAVCCDYQRQRAEGGHGLLGAPCGCSVCAGGSAAVAAAVASRADSVRMAGR